MPTPWGGREQAQELGHGTIQFTAGTEVGGPIIQSTDLHDSSRVVFQLVMVARSNRPCP